MHDFDEGAHSLIDWMASRGGSVTFHWVHGHPRVTARVNGGWPQAERDSFFEALEAARGLDGAERPAELLDYEAELRRQRDQITDLEAQILHLRNLAGIACHAALHDSDLMRELAAIRSEVGASDICTRCGYRERGADGPTCSPRCPGPIAGPHPFTPETTLAAVQRAMKERMTEVEALRAGITELAADSPNVSVTWLQGQLRKLLR